LSESLESERRPGNYDNEYRQVLPHTQLTHNSQIDPFGIQSQRHFFEYQDLPRESLTNRNILSTFSNQSFATTSRPNNSFEEFRTQQKVDPQSNNFVPISDAILPMDDSHPNLFRNLTQNQIDQSEPFLHKKKNQTDQIMEKKKISRKTPTPAPQCIIIDEEKADKNPLPQNLRGDPFRSAKVKTELCRHFGTQKGCPFGDKCNYAHGEHELKYTKLMDLERAGLVDIEIFRTHPCPIWIATGACPFDQRCSGVHDPRASSSHSSWLPHAETLVNGVGISANVDKLYHQQISAVYSCSPIYNYIPRKRWNSDPLQTFLAWRDLYAYVCNLNGNASTWNYDQDYLSNAHSAEMNLSTSFVKDYQNELKSELVRITLALKIREKKVGQSFAYLPSHLFCGELCMVLQTRVFRVQNDLNEILVDNSPISEIDIDPSNAPVGPDNIIVAREIAFGPVGDPGIRQVSVWCNIHPDDLVPCTTQQAKRHKRSRHRLKKDRGKDNTTVLLQNQYTLVGLSKSSSNDDDASKTIEIPEYSPFFNYQPIDNDTFNLVTKILLHRSRVLLLWILSPPPQLKNKITTSLKAYEYQIESHFESLRRHWVTWSWPINDGRGQIDDETDVPPVSGEYELSMNDNNNPCLVYFHGKFESDEGEIISRRTKGTTFLIWQTFINTMKFLKLLKENKTTNEKHFETSFIHPLSNRRRLSILRALSMGFVIDGNNRILPSLKEEEYIKNDPNESEEAQIYAPGTISSLFYEWKTIQDHYDTSSSRSTRTDDDQT